MVDVGIVQDRENNSNYPKEKYETTEHIEHENPRWIG
jgi:hypothetical protein